MGSSNHGCWIGSYEQTKQQIFNGALSPGFVVYDVGAHVGFYSLLASAGAGPTGRVYCFEPLPENVDYLRKHLRINQCVNCEVFEVAVTSMDGVARFDSSRPRSMGWISETGGLLVRTVRLDTLVEEKHILPPNVIKIDVEGAELSVLEGCAQTIGVSRPLIFLATHGPKAHNDCIEFLIAKKYKLQSLSEDPIDRADELLARPD